MTTSGDFEAAFDAACAAAAAATPSAASGVANLRRLWRGSEALLFGAREDVARAAPDFFARVRATVGACRGVALEVGCSIGPLTRWIAAEGAVARVVATDVDPAALAILRALDLPKVDVVDADAATPARVGRVDTLVLCEFVEHVTTRDELDLLARYAPCFAKDARFVLSTPIGFLEDPGHVRGFTKTQFVEHVEGLYGPIDALDYRSGYSQVAVGRLTGPAKPYRG